MSWEWAQDVNKGYLTDLNSCPIAGLSSWSFFTWFKHKGGGTNDDCLWQAADSISSSTVWRIGYKEGGGDLNMYVLGANTPMVGPNVVDDIWQTCMVVVRSSTDRKIYLNNANETTGTVDAESLLMDRVSIGYEGDVTPSDNWMGNIGYSCVWDYVLTADDRARLNAGEHPLSLTHIVDKLVQYEPLDSPLLNQHRLHPNAPTFLVGNDSLSDPFYSPDEPPVYWPHGKMDDLANVNSLQRTMGSS